MAQDVTAHLCSHRACAAIGERKSEAASDNNDRGSIEWGHALFAELGVDKGTAEASGVGSVMEHKIVEHLRTIRPDLDQRSSRRALEFAQ